MANAISSRSYPQESAYYWIALFCLMMLVQKNEATEFKVGGSGDWRVPPDPNTNTYNKWAEKNRFQKGDSLVFVYQAKQDSVLRVAKENYECCNTTSPLESFTDGHTSYKFDQTGHFYFISGNEENCRKNEKLWLIVLADRSNRSNGAAPSPAPNGEAPSPAADTQNPTPSPAADQDHHKSAASSIYLSLVGSFAVLIAAYLALVC